MTRGRRRVGWLKSALALAALALIAFATVTPGARIPDAESGVATTSFWCIDCSATSGADIATNLALFVPLGAALGLLELSVGSAAIVALALSGAIEFVQHTGVVPGRTASATDVATNVAGAVWAAWFVLRRRRWMRPPRARAARYSVVAATCAAAMISFSAWALSRDGSSESVALHISDTKVTPGFGWYHGVITLARVDGVDLPHAGDGPVIVDASTRHASDALVRVTGRDARAGTVPMVYVHGGDPHTPDLMLAERGDDALVHVALRGARIELAMPELPLRGVFASSLTPARDSVMREVHAAVTPTAWALDARTGTTVLRAALPITVALGWSLLQTVVHVGTTSGTLMTVVWLGVLCAPLGFWLRCATRNDDAHNDADRQSPTLALGALAIVVLSLALAPAAAGIAPTSFRDWASAIAGACAGAIIASCVPATRSAA